MISKWAGPDGQVSEGYVKAVAASQYVIGLKDARADPGGLDTMIVEAEEYAAMLKDAYTIEFKEKKR